VSVYAHSWSEAVAYAVAGRGIAITFRSAIAFRLGESIKLISADVIAHWYALWNPSNGNPQLRTVIQMVLDAPPPGWSAIKRAPRSPGASKILRRRKFRLLKCDEPD